MHPEVHAFDMNADCMSSDRQKEKKMLMWHENAACFVVGLRLQTRGAWWNIKITQAVAQ